MKKKKDAVAAGPYVSCSMNAFVTADRRLVTGQITVVRRTQP